MTGCSGREPGINRNMISGLASAGAGGTRRCRRFWTGGSRDTVYSWQGKRTGWSAVDKSAGTWDGNRNHVSWRRALYFRVRRWKWWRNRLGIVWGLVCKIIQNKGRHNRYFFFTFFEGFVSVISIQVLLTLLSLTSRQNEVREERVSQWDATWGAIPYSHTLVDIWKYSAYIPWITNGAFLYFIGVVRKS